MSQKTTSITATCLCTAITFTVTGQPKGAVLCHCSNCKSFAGSAFGHNYRLANATVEYQKGEDKIRKYRDGDTKSGKVLERRFCGECGSSLMNVPDSIPGLVVVCAGAIKKNEADPAMKPKMELFEQDRRAWQGKVAQAAKL